MADLFSWFQSYLNLSKLTAITVPGMVVSFALILVLGPVPCSDSKECPFCPSSLKPVTKANKSKDAASDVDEKAATANDKTKANKKAKTDGNTATAGNTTIAGSTATTTMCGDSAPADKSKTTSNGDDVESCVSVSRTMLKDESGINAANAQIGIYNDLIKPEGREAKLPNPPKPLDKISACADTPNFIPANKAIQFVTSKTKDDVNKAARNKGQKLVPLADELNVLGQCSNELQNIEAQMGVRNATLTQLSTQYGADLGTLSTNYIAARQQGERLVQSDIDRQVGEKKATLAKVQQEQTALATAKSTIDAIYKSVQGMMAALNTAPADTTPATPGAAADVFQAIEQNLLKFLLFSLIVGQILDPIQRGAISFVGPRRNFFRALNLVYGQSGDGEFRYGERRLSPWVEDLGHIVQSTSANEAELRPNDAGRKFGFATRHSRSHELAFEMRDRNLYDKNYAIGAGYITAKEASSIEDEYYGQSQITSGLILPMIILSVCIAIRMICCSTPTAAQDTAAKTTNYVAGNIFLSFSAISFGIALGTMLMLVLLMLSSQRYWTAFAEGRRKFFKHAVGLPIFTFFKRADPERDDSSLTVLRFWFFVVTALVFVVGWIGAYFLTRDTSESNGLHNYLSRLDLLIIFAPTLLAGPLWIAGLDRLHKYYSELSARIAGNILRLDTNSEQKMVDLITDPVAKAKLKESLLQIIKNKETIYDFFPEEKPSGDPDGEV